MIYVIDPVLTHGGDRATDLFQQIEANLAPYSPTSQIRTINAAYDSQPGSADGLLFASPAGDEQLSEAVSALIEEAQAAGAVVLPVALDPGCRRPPEPVEAVQSYDVHDRLRLRSLPASALAVIAQEISRTILARVHPTLTKDKLRLFLCHRRVDAEDITRQLDRALSSRHELVFRDLIDVKPTHDAQRVIESILAEADILVFLDTPRAGESAWILREVELALGRQLPVVWVRINPEQADRIPLRVTPADTPHLTVTITDPSDPSLDWHALADQILAAAFGVGREHVRVAQQTFNRIQRSIRSRGWKIDVLDQRQMIYALSEPQDVSTVYPRRPRTDIVQVFGHRPSDTDQKQMERWLADRDYGPHARTCRAFDAAILLDPLPRAAAVHDALPFVIDHGNSYLERLTGPASEPVRTSARPRRLLILGAFPEGVDSQEPVKQAVYALATNWLTRGGHLTFGGHPTFVPLITEVGYCLLGSAAPSRITIYQSRYWVTDTIAEALSQLATIQLVDAAADRPHSLTAMRQRMIRDVASDLVVVVGGRTSEGGTHTPGVDEEIDLARAAHYPLYLLGAPGGRAAELAAGQHEEGWAGLTNNLDATMNEWLSSSEDYQDIADLLWRAG